MFELVEHERRVVLRHLSEHIDYPGLGDIDVKIFTKPNEFSLLHAFDLRLFFKSNVVSEMLSGVKPEDVG